MKHFHNNNSSNKDPFSNSGVYEIQCNMPGCSANYIGQTKRSFNIRYKEHRNAIRHNKFSAFCNHAYDENHPFTKIDSDLKILHLENGYKQLNIKEAIEIHTAKKNNPNNLNDHTFLKKSPLFSLLP